MVITMNVDKVRYALEKNEVLTEDVKSDFFELTLIFNKQYPDIALDRLAERLENVKVEVVSRFIREEAVYYNDKTNTIQINASELNQTNNTKHILMTSLLNMITKTDKDAHLMAGFRDGLTNIIANNLVGSEEETLHINEILANQTALIVGAHVATDAFMKNDVNVLINAFTAHGIHPKKAETFLREWSYDATRGKTDTFATHQMRLLTIASVANIVTDSLLMNIVTNPSYLAAGNYGNLSVLEDEVKKIQEERFLNKKTQRTM